MIRPILDYDTDHGILENCGSAEVDEAGGAGVQRAPEIAGLSSEDEGRQRVAVLGPTVLEALGINSPDAIIGEAVRIRGIQFNVIGVLKSKGQATPFGNPDD